MAHQDIELLRTMRSAIKSGDVNTVRLLLEESPDRLNIDTPFGSWLHVAASAGHTEVVALLLSLGADIDRRSGVFDAAPIKEAASGGHVEIVKLLLARGAKLDTSDPERNPLFAAIYGGHLNIVRLLLESGIDHTVRYTGQYMKNMGAVDFAIERGQTEIATVLQAWGIPSAT